jgi:DNA repair photolyase
MRWESLTVRTDEAGMLPLGLPDAVVRTFDTPSFAGMTFYEIRAKSIISRVPAASRMFFEWTINPYRGCSHACVYCLAPETPVLLADGSERPIADLRVGDAIVGTEADGVNRVYRTTQVLAAWSTVKPAYRVTLDDGTELVASADHRFLSDRGWRHVAAPHGESLGPGDKVVGVGQLGPVGAGPDGLRSVVAVEALGQRLRLCDITTGTGDFIAAGVVSHNCFARNTHTYLDLDAGRDFDSKVIVKVNAPDLLRRELAAPRWTGAHIAMGTNVDCYQRAEGRYQLMRGIIAALRDYANPFSILTKGTLITRDLDLLAQAAEVTNVDISFSIGFLDEALWRAVEPGTPSPRRRLDAVRQFADAGFAPTVLIAPILPGLTDTDESIDATVAAVTEAGAASAVPILLHLRPGAREWYIEWLNRTHPQLADRYRAIYGRGSYAPKAYQKEIGERVAEAVRRHGLGRRAGVSSEASAIEHDRRNDDAYHRRVDRPSAPAARPAPPPEQLTLI